ncbi:MAG: Nramp family divalent metal transporter [Acidobacteria bacterium]|nr:Nramp family divalent metal transporter [Acidobacteriota bacterium]
MGRVNNRPPFRFRILLPGILVAATGVGAGDLMTASIAGSEVGLTVLWAAVAGAFLKGVLNEGIARWQMATETTLLEGWFTRLGRWVQWVFMVYFFLWTLMVGGALVSACGVAGAGLLPLGDPNTSRIVWGVVHSLLGLALVWIGGFPLFEKLMAACIALMFVSVLVTAALLSPDWNAVLAGSVIPRISQQGTPWLLGVLGGVGGTVTLLSYGYWIREQGRAGETGLRTCRLDLAVAYALTALFGLAMILIGSRITVQGQGAQLALQLAQQLGSVLGPWGKWMFLVGFWGAVFSSLLGVWQSAPYFFADFLSLRQRNTAEDRLHLDLSKTRSYRAYLLGIATVPLVLLWGTVRQVQLTYAVMGALFMPLLALTLLIMNNRGRWVGSGFRNGWFVNAVLVVVILLFAYMGALQLLGRMPSFGG